MTYRSYIGGPTTYSNETWSYPQTYMMYDIAALQYMYGADYTANSGNTVYSWSPGSGQTLINGTAATNPGGNRIFATIWDGGGVDTYDLSAYTTDLDIDLRPGEHSVFSTSQLANLDSGDANNLARGNIFNALLYDDDTRSLIENATGGSGNDTIVGNDGNNTLNGGLGGDSLFGNDGGDRLNADGGNDHLEGGAGSDVLEGDTGRDTMVGGADPDFFQVYNWGGVSDVESGEIYDGGSGVDWIQIFPSVSGTFNFRPTTVISIERLSFNSQFSTTSTVTAQFDLADWSFTQVSAGTGTFFAEIYLNDDESIDLSSLSISGMNATDGMRVFGGGGDESITGSSVSDTIEGGFNADTLDGGNGDDRIWGHRESSPDGSFVKDVIRGGLGDDTIVASNGFGDSVEGGSGADSMDGGGGTNDLLSYKGSNAGVVVALGAGSGSGSGGHAQGDTNTGFEQLLGSAHDDVIGGSGNADTLIGAGGGDTINASGGNDRVHGDAIPFGLLMLNQGGVTDQYAEATTFADMPTDAFTAEWLFRGTGIGAGGVSFLSYAVSGSSNEFLVFGNPGGNVTVWVNGVSTDTGYAVGNLLDGEVHRMSVSVDTTAGTNGQISLYVDGVEEFSGSGASASVGSAITSGGTLIVGQDQDSLGGSFDGTQALRGGMGDIRIWSSLRSQGQVDATKFTRFDGFDEADNPDLVANWQLDPAALTFANIAGDEALTPQSGANAFSAETFAPEGGNDSIGGGGGLDTIEGGQGNDTLDGGTGSDDVFGQAGDDRILLVSGGIWVDELTDGGAGNDTLVVQNLSFGHSFDLDTGGSSSLGTHTGFENFEGITNTGNAVIGGTAGANLIETGSGNDSIDGLAGNDTIDGGGGNDTIDGGANDDDLDGGAGARDVVSYASAPGAVTVSIGTDGNGSASGAAGNDTLADFEVIEGSASGDDLTLLRGAFSSGGGGGGIFGRGGNDLLTIATFDGGDTTVEGGAGNDTIKASAGFFVGDVDGGDDFDTFDASAQANGMNIDLESQTHEFRSFGDLSDLIDFETVIGTAGSDSITADDLTSNRIEGGSGNDTLDAGNDFVANTLHGGANDDEIIVSGFLGDDLDGGVDTDTLVTSQNAIFAPGLVIDLGLGTVTFNGNPVATATDFENYRHDGPGGSDEDVIGSALANRVEIGGTGDNLVRGLAGDDTILAGDGDDTVEGGLGADSLDGGGGSRDMVSYAGSAGPVQVSFASAYALEGDAAGDVLSGFEDLRGSEFDDQLFGDDEDNIIEGLGGVDDMNGNGGRDTLRGGAGNDLLSVGGAGDLVSGEVFDGGTEEDTLVVLAFTPGIYDFRGSTLTSLEKLSMVNPGSSPSGELRAQFTADQFVDAGFQELTGNPNPSSGMAYVMELLMEARAALDLSLLSVTGFVQPQDRIEISGDGGAEAITGSEVDDMIDGAGGDDTLEGGSGNDTIAGGAGLGDRAVFAGELDRYAFEVQREAGGSPRMLLVHDTQGGDVDRVHEDVELLAFDDVTLGFGILAADAMLTRGELLERGFGSRFGTNLNRTGEASFAFETTSGAQDMALELGGFDIDTGGEVEVLVNGVSLGNLGAGANEATTDYTLALPAAALEAGYNLVTFRQLINPTFTWGVENLRVSTPADLALTGGLADPTVLGNQVGAAANITDGTALVSFTGTDRDLRLDLQGIDIDFGGDEVELFLNDVSLGMLAGTPDNGSGPSSFAISAAQQLPGENLLRFEQTRNDSFKWGISDLHLAAPTDFDLTPGTLESGEFGNNFNGASDADGVVTGGFQGTDTDLVVSLAGFDIDFDGEVALRLNGETLAELPAGANQAETPYRFAIDAGAQAGEQNILEAVQLGNPGWAWGITDIEIAAPDAALVTGATETGEYGNDFNGATAPGGEVTMTFAGTGKAADVPMRLEVAGFDIDFADEVEVRLNSTVLGNLDLTPNNGTGVTGFDLPAAALLAGENVLTFEQMRNDSFKWGVTDVHVRSLTDFTLQGTTPETGSWGNNFNGATAPDARVTGAFQADGGPVVLRLGGFDVDFDDEVQVGLNGTALRFLEAGVNDATQPYVLGLPGDRVLEGENLLSFTQERVPTWKWGVTDISATPADMDLALDTVERGVYGKGYLGTSSDTALAVFDTDTDALRLDLRGFDIDLADEVEILLNGQSQGFLSGGAANNNTLADFDLTLDPTDVLANETNVLEFRQAINPNFTWAITEIELSATTV
ncbi:M10 family metallopeptidase C-terminal domain-containing protein [Cribrihabitans sp. XS_ASV171]